ncbi:TPA: hypothetical protein HA251_08720 [Candidatus Woesearchaeota archaeon]|nr:hypothetical protein [Candidatus Woesearchaeota archaeon]
MSNLQFFDIGKTELELERCVRAYEHNGWTVITPQPPLLDPLSVHGVLSPRGEFYDLHELAMRSHQPLHIGDRIDLELRDAADLMNVLYNLYGAEFVGPTVAQYAGTPCTVHNEKNLRLFD